MAQMIHHTMKEFVELLEGRNLLVKAICGGQEETEIQNLTYNSKEVTENTLFICKGAAFKEEYLKEALANGAIGYISEICYESCEEVPHLIVTDIREAMPILANYYFNSPWEDIHVIGI